MRRIALAALVCMVGAGWGVSSAAADPVNNPNVQEFTVTCAGMTPFHVVPVGSAGHVLENNSIAVLLAGTVTTFVNGDQVDQNTFDHKGKGTSTLACGAVAEFTAGPDTIKIVITGARIHLTPASG